MTLYVFDVDGTLTEPASRMTDGFAASFAHWARGKRYFLTSGSTLARMREQLPPDILAHAEGWFPCQGNEYWSGGKQVYSRSFTMPEGLLDLLDFYAVPEPAGNCVEFRGSMICFAPIGRSASPEQRADYAAWDMKHGQRRRIATDVVGKFPELYATLGGQISVDIAPMGMDKGQVLRVLRWTSSLPVVFFADKARPGGNDYPLAQALNAEGGMVNAVFHTTGPDATQAMLEVMDDCGC